MARFSTINVSVDLVDVFDEISDDELREEAISRNMLPKGSKVVSATDHERREDFLDLAHDLRGTVARGDRQHLEVLIERFRALIGVERLTIPEGKVGGPLPASRVI